VSESVDHALVGAHAVGDRELVANVGEGHGHGRFLIGDGVWAVGRKAEAARARKSFASAGARSHYSKRLNSGSAGLLINLGPASPWAEPQQRHVGLLVRDLVPAALEVLHVAILTAAVPVDADADVAERIKLANFALERLTVDCLGLTQKQLGALA